jgi:hypothetical protein
MAGELGGSRPLGYPAVPVLVVCVEGSASEADAQAWRDLFQDLIEERWLQAPALVDQVDDVPATDAGDLSVLRTVGLALALPEPGESRYEDVVRRDVERLIMATSTLAAKAGVELVVEYREEQIGWLDGGPEDAAVIRAISGA